jgi:hypothetical protein
MTKINITKKAIERYIEKNGKNGKGWFAAYYANDLDDLPLGYIKKVEALLREMNVKIAEPYESRRLDRSVIRPQASGVLRPFHK